MPSRPAGADPAAALVRRERGLVWAGLVALAAGAWAYLWHLRADMPMGMAVMAAPVAAPWGAADVGFTFLMWAVMMVGMMLPSAAPMVLLFATVNRRRREQGTGAVPTGLFALGYLLAWTAFSAAATAAQGGLHWAAVLSPVQALRSPLAGGLLLVAAGVYQFSPLKGRCLRHCRSPLGWLMTEWRDGPRGAVVMGLRHGAYCVGCCWILMALLFVTGVMNLLWVAALAVLVLLEKVAPGGVALGRLAGGGLVVGGLLLVLRAVGSP